MAINKDADMQRAWDAIDPALALAGFVILDGEHDQVIFRSKETDRDFCIKIEEITP